MHEDFHRYMHTLDDKFIYSNNQATIVLAYNLEYHFIQKKMERQEIELLRYKDGKFGGHLRHNSNSSKYVLYLDFPFML